MLMFSESFVENASCFELLIFPNTDYFVTRSFEISFWGLWIISYKDLIVTLFLAGILLLDWYNIVYYVNLKYFKNYVDSVGIFLAQNLSIIMNLELYSEFDLTNFLSHLNKHLEETSNILEILNWTLYVKVYYLINKILFVSGF